MQQYYQLNNWLQQCQYIAALQCNSSPALVKDIIKLERVQTRATKLIPELKQLSYEERLEKLGMPTLKARRVKLDLVQAYIILCITLAW